MTKKEMTQIGQDASKDAIIGSYQKALRQMQNLMEETGNKKQIMAYQKAIRGLRRDIAIIRKGK